MRILVVEDEKKLAEIIARGLKAEGFAVDVADDGARGLELATAYAYDVILLAVKAYERAAIRAAVTGSTRDLRAAMLLHPAIGEWEPSAQLLSTLHLG